MADPKKAWEEVGDRLYALGLKLKLHTEEGSEGSKEFTSALDKLRSTISDVFDGLGDAARDPAVKDDAKSFATALADAVDTTVAHAKARLQQRSE